MKTLVATAAAAAAIVIVPPAASARPDTAPASAAAFDGSVAAMAYSDGRYFVGGDFTAATDGDGDEPRHRLAAVDRQGRLTDFAPRLDAPVTAIASDGEYLYVAGEFTEADGRQRHHLARFDQATGSLDETFRPRVEGTIGVLDTYGDRLYVGGELEGGDLIALHSRDGREVAAFHPEVDGAVHAVHATASRVYAGGEFTKLSGETVGHLAALRPADGSREPTFAPDTGHEVDDIVESGGKVFTVGGGRLDALSDDGARQWGHVTDGDLAALATHDGELYAAGDFQNLCRGDKTASDGSCVRNAEPRRHLFATSFEGDVTDWNAAPAAAATALASSPSELAVGGRFASFSGSGRSAGGFALFT